MFVHNLEVSWLNSQGNQFQGWGLWEMEFREIIVSTRVREPSGGEQEDLQRLDS